MNIIRTAIPDVLILEPKVFGDARGFFMESFNARAFREATDHPGSGPFLAKVRAGEINNG